LEFGRQMKTNTEKENSMPNRPEISAFDKEFAGESQK
jgi:hypothetical protein